MRNFFTFHLDSIGFSASLLCAVHCAAVPVILTFSTLGIFSFLHNPILELTMIIASLSFVLASLIPCYFKHHRKAKPILCATLGFAFMLSGKLEWLQAYESFLIPAGGSVVAFTHYVNWKLCSITKCDNK